MKHNLQVSFLFSLLVSVSMYGMDLQRSQSNTVEAMIDSLRKTAHLLQKTVENNDRDQESAHTLLQEIASFKDMDEYVEATDAQLKEIAQLQADIAINMSRLKFQVQNSQAGSAEALSNSSELTDAGEFALINPKNDRTISAFKYNLDYYIPKRIQRAADHTMTYGSTVGILAADFYFTGGLLTKTAALIGFMEAALVLYIAEF